MSIFKDSSSKKHIPGTTDGFFFGAPEAEAEKKYEEINNVSFFDDYFEVIDEISSNKFIISGRKGTYYVAFNTNLTFFPVLSLG